MKAILTILFLLSSLLAIAQDGCYTYTNILTKGELIANKKVKVRDPLLADQNLSGVSPVLTYFTKVSLVYGREDFTDVGSSNPWSLKVKFKIEYSGSLVLASKTVTNGLELEIYGGSSNPVYEANRVMTENYGIGTLTVTNVSSTGTVPMDVRLELSLAGVRVQNLEVNKAPELYYDAESNKLSWTYLPGSNTYELEWVFIDFYDQVNQGESPFLVKEPVKVVTGEPFYFPNITLPEGKVYYRVRAVGTFKGADNNSLDFSPWSYGNASQAATMINTTPFEKDKLWQYTSSFAEEGKYKKVMNFYDGSLRSRQVLTNLSTDKGTLIGETKYDYEGRPVVQVMPTFISGSNLGYVPSLNNFENTGIGKAAYDNAASSAYPMSKAKVPLTGHADVNGAASYYSSDNIPETLNRDYLPDAEQYPYSQIEYMADNTGRLKRQSGIGETFKMKSDNARITKYFYTGAKKAELHRLFGATTLPGNPGPATGDSSHYTKDFVADPNGQLSVSYKDQTDRVIATCLAGDSSKNLLEIERDDPEIIANLMEDNILDKVTGTSKSVTKVMQANQYGTDYKIDYKLTPVINKVTGDICTACTYEVTIRILDPEGKNILAASTEFPKQKVPGSNEVNCGDTAHAYTSYTWIFNQRLETLGVYTIIKEVKLTAGAIDLVKIQLEQNPPDVSLIGVPEFPNMDALEEKHKLLADAKAPMCDVSCEQMAKTALSYRNFSGAILDDSVSAWVKKYCNPKSVTDTISEKECFSLKEEMIQQVLPGGFWNPLKTETILNSPWLTQVWNSVQNWGDSVPTSISNLNDPLKFKLKWADVMVKLHPEYCHYEFCMMERETKTFDKNRSLLQNWGEAGIIESQRDNFRLYTGDPFLQDFQGNTFSSQRGSINESLTVDLPYKHLNYFNENPGPGVLKDINQDGEYQILSLSKFVFSSSLYSENGGNGSPQFSNPEDNAKTWRLFSNLYLGYKTRRLTELREQKGCPYRRPGRLGEFSQSEIDHSVSQYPLQEGINDIDDPVAIANKVNSTNAIEVNKLCSNEVLDNVVASWIDILDGSCQLKIKLDSGNISIIKNNLKVYASQNCGIHNGNNQMFIEDIVISPNLITVQNLLNTYSDSCPLYLIGINRPICVTKTVKSYNVNPLFIPRISFVNEFLDSTRIEGSGNNGFIIDKDYNILKYKSYDLYWSYINCYKTFEPTTDDCHYLKISPRDEGDYFSFRLGTGPAIGGGNYHNIVSFKKSDVNIFLLKKIKDIFPDPSGSGMALVNLELIDGRILNGIKIYSYSTNGPTNFNSFVPQGIPSVQSMIEVTLHDVCEAPPCPNIKKLTITNRPTTSKTKRAWRIFNPNPGDIKVDWHTNYPEATGSLVVKGKSPAFLYTNAETPGTYQELTISVFNKNTKPYAPGQNPISSEHERLTSDYIPAKIHAQGVWTEDDSVHLWSFYNPYNFDVDIHWTFGTQVGILKAKAKNETLLSTHSKTETNETQLVLTSTALLNSYAIDNEITQPEPTPEDLFNTNCGIDEAIIKQNCLDDLYNQAHEEALKEYNLMLDTYVTHYISQHHNKCFDNPYKEVFTNKYKPGEYHFTLYYYDQAGNLVQTVPPAGVDIQKGNATTGVITTIPTHRLKTTYRYNSLGQVVYQNTPDAGETYFWYNNMGQLSLSQNAKQALANVFSVSKYDKQGRVILTGQLHSLVEIDPKVPANAKAIHTIIDVPEFPGDAAVLTEVSLTEYDVPTENAGFQQENLRNRVSAVYQLDEYPVGNAATFYSYDQHGNVKRLVQKVNPDPALPHLQMAKEIRYEYDLISGKVNRVDFQKGETDQFSHKYRYDADNRLVSVKTSADGYLWEEDARYFYMKHGPLGRIELGEDKVQGLDYFYTLQGWLKGINVPAARTGTTNKRIEMDPGKDGAMLGGNTSPNSYIAEDEYALSLGYFKGDYKPIGGVTTALGYANADSWENETLSKNILSITPGQGSKGLYNGNIAYTIQQVHKIGEAAGALESHSTLAYAYQYDQLNRIRNGYAYERGATSWNREDEKLNASRFDVMYNYDPNGNIKVAKLNGSSSSLMDDLVYKYREYQVNGKTVIRDNKLYHVEKNASNTSAESQLKLQEAFIDNESTINTVNNYGYDLVGNLTRDKSEGIASIEWTLGGKVKKVNRTVSSTASNLEFFYDAMGNRVLKIRKGSGLVALPKNTWEYTYYMRDASGNVMQTQTVTDGKTTSIENPVYGSSRLGVFKNNSDHNISITGLYNGPKYKGGSSLTMAEDADFTVGSGATLFVTSSQIITGNITLSQGSTLVVEGTLGSASIITLNGACTIWIAQSGTWNAESITLKNNAYLKNYGLLNLSGTLNFANPSNFINYGTLTSALSAKSGGIMNRAGVWMVSGSANQHVSLVNLPNGKMEIDFTMVESSTAVTTAYQRYPIQKEYELNDHLSNVMVVVSGRATGVDTDNNGKADYYTANVVDANFYYPFGAELPGRKFTLSNYRYGFNAQEKDQETETYAFHYRMHDPRLGRFWSVDPLASKYPWNSTYAFAENRVIDGIDLEGLEFQSVHTKSEVKSDGSSTAAGDNTGIKPQERLLAAPFSPGAGTIKPTPTGFRANMSKVEGYLNTDAPPMLSIPAKMAYSIPDAVSKVTTFQSLSGTPVSGDAEYTSAVTSTALNAFAGVGMLRYAPKLTVVSQEAIGTNGVLKVNELHFMQSSIKNATGEFTVLGNANSLMSGGLNPEVLRMNVWRDASGKAWTLDHRRLAAFKLSGLQEAPIQWANPSGQMWKMTTTTGGTSTKLKLGGGNSIIVE